jgi:hypothetical protein
MNTCLRLGGRKGCWKSSRDTYFKYINANIKGKFKYDIICADPKEIIFTSGATESNNMSLKGIARFYKSSKKYIITTQIVSTINVNNNM